jgi:hypothetical protein
LSDHERGQVRVQVYRGKDPEIVTVQAGLPLDDKAEEAVKNRAKEIYRARHRLADGVALRATISKSEKKRLRTRAQSRGRLQPA